jgi:hypothetical protein
MPWTTITDTKANIDAEIADFESGVTSIDAFSVAGHEGNSVTAVIQYTA